MNIIDTCIADVKIIQPRVFGDERGFFLETFEQRRYQEMLGIRHQFVQDNRSRSVKGALRGLHFQVKRPQGKLVYCVRGEVFDVVVDIRPDSATFGEWVGVLLSEENNRQMWIPPGFAHGFVALSEVADFEYKCTDYYAPQDEGCLVWNDSDVGIEWPIDCPLLSVKDQQGKTLKEIVK